MVLPTPENGKLTTSLPIITDFGEDPWDSLPRKRLRLFSLFLFCAAFGASVLLKGFVDFIAVNFF